MLYRAFILLILSLCSSPLLAHKLAPALLDLTPQDQAEYQVLWRVGLQTAPLTLHWPSDCVAADGSLSRTGTALDHHYILQCTSPLDGRVVSVEGLEAARTAVLVRVNEAESVNQSLITAADPQHRFNAHAAPRAVAIEYLLLGIEHILIGLDHLLLVLGLFLITQGWRALAANVTAFTLGHSITLAVASLDIVHVPGTWVELTIALTILMLALSLSRRPVRRLGHQWMLFSVFGLVHGMGFAGVLGDIGLPRQDLLTALLAFNLGIEVGQIAFIAALAGFFALAAQIHTQVNRAAQSFAIYSMGSLACFWCIERGLLLLK